jgi:uncharacterized protein DUF6158
MHSSSHTPVPSESFPAQGDRDGAGTTRPALGVDPVDLSTEELLRELASLHDTRHETLRHGSDAALTHHGRRTSELEREYLRRFPEREVDPHRMREGGQ